MNEIVIKSPTTLKELVQILAVADNNTYMLSGGTDFIIKMRREKINNGTIINLKDLKELNYITNTEDYVKIGGITTLTEISCSSIVDKYATALKEATGKVGSTQIRNAATLAGNIANSAPCADTVTALMALSAKVKIINGSGEIYEKKVDDIVLGSEKNSLKRDEVIIEVNIPIDLEARSSFGKIGSRTAVTISKLNMAVTFKYNHEMVINEAMVVIGAIGPKAFNSSTVANSLLNKKINTQFIYLFEETLQKQVDEAILGRASHPYKREAIRGLADDIMKRMFPQIMTGGELS
ncbi:hypothetical protein F8154_08055 [Alkaliphilus pronyensis]|uniref:FAD-binding PCMH-type domain-containing protein n=1 Tax=Alkaliphilus pronyensis TaxID=1482732 RepID=A0A6I0FAV0_9FIRM|nr:FAD binding domain-containing protein [Alkaliphilus pronyensis]KAB3534805.1 hypothetical protein F8154_08055 [Alkaliphilus pronyensis]